VKTGFYAMPILLLLTTLRAVFSRQPAVSWKQLDSKKGSVADGGVDGVVANCHLRSCNFRAAAAKSLY